MASNKKLYRSKSDRKLAGICGGLSQYFGLDSNIFRIIWIVIFLCGTLGFWLYVLAWLFIPEEPLDNQLDFHKNDQMQA